MQEQVLQSSTHVTPSFLCTPLLSTQPSEIRPSLDLVASLVVSTSYNANLVFVVMSLVFKVAISKQVSNIAYVNY